jgi:leucyl aminopeptidase
MATLKSREGLIGMKRGMAGAAAVLAAAMAAAKLGLPLTITAYLPLEDLATNPR